MISLFLIRLEYCSVSCGVRLCGFFFFFQAEDGIRDIGVTGVQTCALPIFHPRRDGARALYALPVGRAPRAPSLPQAAHLAVATGHADGPVHAAELLVAQIGRASCRERV